MKSCLTPVEPCFNMCGCSQFLTHLAHETKGNRNMSWEWECKCDFMALWSRRHSIYSYRLERRGYQRNENKNNLRYVCIVIFHLHQTLEFIFHMPNHALWLLQIGHVHGKSILFSWVLLFIYPCKNRKPGFVFPIEIITRFKNFLFEIMLSPFIIVLNT